MSSLTGSEKSTKRVRSMGRYEWERELWNCPDIPAAYKGVLTALSFFSDFETGRNARPGESLLQEVTCASRSTVNRALRYGREEGWLHRNWTGGGTKKDESGKRLADEYWLTIPRHGHGHELDDVKRRI
ncbi:MULTISPECIES: hypothetical protein [unclassified Streptomyces]|uniref:hypothetical protein n=1 Tax=unclassified Streptomyces TaxID=2593676 RepID=UPI002E81E5D6|nr:hypothetical protein [Streptomyces sp. NBC_00569]WUB95144.1 hypothetical protein OHO83_24095 [Streptomyces sp. NBC_00569]